MLEMDEQLASVRSMGNAFHFIRHVQCRVSGVQNVGIASAAGITFGTGNNTIKVCAMRGPEWI